MRLVLDTSVLVGELLRSAGRRRLGDDRLDLFLPEQMWGETRVELPRRVAAFARRRGLDPEVGDQLVALCLEAIEANVDILDEAIYAALEDEARARSIRDASDWPVVATALAVGRTSGPTTTTSSARALRHGQRPGSKVGSTETPRVTPQWLVLVA